MSTIQNSLAQRLASLHVPGNPLLLANVWDAATASLIASQPETVAIATASYAIAATQAIEDNDMTLEANLVGVKNVVAGLAKSGKAGALPLTTDLQDGYDNPAETIKQAISLGAVGCNIEDVNNQTGQLRDLDNAVDRIRILIDGAAKAGVPDFVVNARTDVLGYGGNIDHVVERGRKFLEAGATTVFVWGVGKWDITEEEVQKMTAAFGGRLAVQPGSLGIEKLKLLGVSRISVGPALWRKSMAVILDAAEEMKVL